MAVGTVRKGRHWAPRRLGLTLQLTPTGNAKRIALPFCWFPTSLSTAVKEGSMPRGMHPSGVLQRPGLGQKAPRQDICHSYYCCPGMAGNKHRMSRDPTLQMHLTGSLSPSLHGGRSCPTSATSYAEYYPWGSWEKP